MKSTFRIEFFKLKRHPLMIMMIALTLGVLALLFYRLCVDYLQSAHLALHRRDPQISILNAIIKPLCSWSIVVLALVVPLLTLYSFTQEYRQKTFYLWAMSPLKAACIVLGKWLFLELVLLLILAFMLLMISTLSFSTTLNWYHISLNMAMVFLVTSSILSFGLFVSSLFSNPILALGFTYVIEFAWLMLQWLNPFPKNFQFLAKELSLLNHCQHALLGIIYTPDLIFFILIMILMLTLTTRQVKHKMTHIML